MRKSIVLVANSDLSEDLSSRAKFSGSGNEFFISTLKIHLTIIYVTVNIATIIIGIRVLAMTIITNM